MTRRQEETDIMTLTIIGVMIAATIGILMIMAATWGNVPDVW
jgi:hypothetical protein